VKGARGVSLTIIDKVLFATGDDVGML